MLIADLDFFLSGNMCGIFAYLNFLTPKTRSEIIDVLIKGLQRMEYRGYDSAGHFVHPELAMISRLRNFCGLGIAIGGEPGTPNDETVLIRKAGKVSNLAESIKG